MKEHVYFVAAYLRLSREDEDIDGSTKSETPYGYTSMPCGRKVESNSISSQRELIRSYVREHEDMELFDIYVDM